MGNNLLIPEGFKDHVDFNTNVEHEYKNKIIPKLFKLYNLIGDKIPRHTEDLEFVDDLT